MSKIFLAVCLPFVAIIELKSNPYHSQLYCEVLVDLLESCCQGTIIVDDDTDMMYVLK